MASPVHEKASPELQPTNHRRVKTATFKSSSSSMALQGRERGTRVKAVSKRILPSCVRGTYTSSKKHTQVPRIARSPKFQMARTKKPAKHSVAHHSKQDDNNDDAFKILTLPSEIQCKVLGLLDYKSLLSMSATNKHLQNLIRRNDMHLLKLALLDFEEESAPWRTNVKGEITYSPCYGCLKTLSRCHFLSTDWYSSTTSSGERAFKRRCQTCISGGQLSGPSRVFVDNQAWLYCEGCKTVTHMVAYQSCGVWDHERGGKINCFSRHVLESDVSLCMECRPWNWSYSKGKEETARARIRRAGSRCPLESGRAT